ncbi:YicC/YloC family endoribonuclease [Rhizomicrobium electricum]|uniref:YicC family protein n=1 Tax=Rhizomicrobium electricum TaxID=480070 RepID=A0ABP3PAH9_9PROT|nr:YicC/YloC family endoribonuclease [Rhizomicrobium electricum]NIJ48221.1 uncharacterized protein (TIGR00255 family) [Rhizomicrobium electricum]
MALVSMTGFAEGHGGLDAARWRWEARSVNGRGLELRLRLPPGFESIEPAARALATSRFKRGNLQATLSYDPGAATRGLRVDPVALAAAVKIAQDVAGETGLAPARVDGLLALKGVIIQDEGSLPDPEAQAARDTAVLKTLADCFDALAKARSIEGAKLAVVLTGQIDEIARLTEAATQCAATQPAAIRDRLAAQLADLVAPGTVSAERLEQEIAMLATKADIREEIDRLGAHVSEARRLIGSGDTVGRRLDFLAQEFNREANTLCSKSSDIDLTRLGLDLKTAIDQFREQLQNVE